VRGRRIFVDSGIPYLPDELLIQSYAQSYGWHQERLKLVLVEFGPLPKAGQEQLIGCLVLAFGRYQFKAKTVERITPSQKQNQLNDIEKNAKSLLKKLATPAVRMWLGTARVSIADRATSDVNIELGLSNRLITDAIRGLDEIHTSAKLAGQLASKEISVGRGGKRRRPDAKGLLTRDAIIIYSHMRTLWPDSGNPPGFGGPMVRFAQGVGHLFSESVSVSNIRDAWRARKSKKNIY
jgi:hypothetical protein